MNAQRLRALLLVCAALASGGVWAWSQVSLPCAGVYTLREALSGRVCRPLKPAGTAMLVRGYVWGMSAQAPARPLPAGTGAAAGPAGTGCLGSATCLALRPWTPPPGSTIYLFFSDTSPPRARGGMLRVRVQRLVPLQALDPIQAFVSRVPLLASLFPLPQQVAWGQRATYRIIVLPPNRECRGVCVRAILPDAVDSLQTAPEP